MYDVVVVGSGLGGLMTAVILAKEGLSVCVLEKNNQFGGNLQTFSRDKKVFDTGVHYLGGLDQGQNLYRYFAYVGIMEGLKLEKMPTVVDEICFADDPTRYPIAQGYATFVQELSYFFPNEVDSLKRYITDLQKVCESFPLYNLSDQDRYPGVIMQLSLQKYMDSLTTNELLKAVLMGNGFLYAAEGKQTPFYVHALSVNSYLVSAYRCVNGASQISKLLVRELRKLGGTAYRHQEVVKYELEEGEVKAVLTAEGKRFSAKLFVSNIDPAITLQQVGKTYFRSVYYNRIIDQPQTVSSFSGHFVLKPREVVFHAPNVFYHDNLDAVRTASDYQLHNWPRTIMWSMTEDKANPGFADTVTGLTYMKFEEVEHWENTHNTVVKKADRGKLYNLFKEEKLHAMLSRSEMVIPGLSKVVLSSYASTPLSYRDYIGSRAGCLYGPLKNVTDPLRTMLSPKTKIPNLYLTGQGVNMHGILGVAIGAVSTCGEILGRSYLIQKINEQTRAKSDV